MLSTHSKTNNWGCTACYNHQRKNGKDYCTLDGREIEELKICPLGLTAAVSRTIA